MTHELEDHHPYRQTDCDSWNRQYGISVDEGYHQTRKLTPAKKIIACDINIQKLQALAAEWKIRTAADSSAAVKASEILLLCVKPRRLPVYCKTV